MKLPETAVFYHGTSMEKADKIKECGYFDEGTHFTANKGFAKTFGEFLFVVEIPIKELKIRSVKEMWGTTRNKLYKTFI